ncbi:amino acid adenylation domain-containing protein [Psychrobacillus sp. L4]|uniref:amino acid adenylation domain-containing protein n=1 Tax=Psychrobacillus sp. L4 TaxID=3236892 RepID=UPI0036F4087D
MSENKIILSSLEQIKKSEEYWKEKLFPLVEKTTFSADYNGSGYKRDKMSRKIDEHLFNKLIAITKNNDLSIYTLMLSILKIELFKFSGIGHIIIGSPVYIKSSQETTLNNILPIKDSLNESISFKELLMNTKDNILESYKNQIFPLDQITNKIGIKDIFDILPVSCTMKNIHNEKDISALTNHKKNQITFLIVKEENSIFLELVYNSSLFKSETIEKIIDVYLNIMKQAFENIDKKLSDFELLTNIEKEKILFDFNDNKLIYSGIRTIQELFEAQVEKNPNDIAVVCKDEQLTYRELNEMANYLARGLRKKGVKADIVVGIIGDRSLEMIIGILGILKAGGAYLPIDPGYSKERLQFVLEDSKSKVLIGARHLTDIPEFKGEFLEVKDELQKKEDSSNLKKNNTSNNLAYVIYTSGTTGVPKGVMIEHKSVHNLVLALNKEIYYQYPEKLKVGLVAPFYFDGSVKQIFAALVNGHALYIADDEVRRDAEKLLKYYEKNKIDISDGTPAHLEVMSEFIGVDKELRIKHLLIGGDRLNNKLLEKLFKASKELKISNVYGPTECCVDSSIYLVNREETILMRNTPIGKPISNTQVYIVDKNLKLMPIGIPGELCISGDGLARGYLNRPELTKEKFVDNPFKVGQKMYKTGDLAKWLPDGNIECLGRIDNQVKIRGFRIELGEIENVLLQHEELKEVAVVVNENKEQEKFICAYLVSKVEVDILNLRVFLKDRLPEYMIPSYFTQLEKLPLTQNGKLDRRALPEPKRNTTNKYEAPRNGVEKKLSEMWTEILDTEKISINDNFFHLGGHSLKATVLMAKVHKELDVEIPLKVLFDNPTISGLSEFIKNAQKNQYVTIEKAEERAFYKASSSQKRMYTLQQMDKQSTAYNMPIIIEIHGKVEFERIEDTFQKIVERQEILRTSFKANGYEIVQKVDSYSKFKLTIGTTLDGFVRPFKLDEAPLFRAELVEENKKTYLLIDMHHIISDGVSMSILMKEFKAFYEREKMEPLTIQYKDYSEWQNELFKKNKVKKQEEYWMKVFNNEIPVLNIPYDNERPTFKTYEGASLSKTINKEITEGLRIISRETGSTMHMVLFSAFSILLSKYSGQEDLVIGIPVAGRTNVDLQKIMGMFVNTLAIRSNPSGEKSYDEFLKEIKSSLLTAYENQDYQLEKLIENLNIRRDAGRNPLFDVMFSMDDAFEGKELELVGTTFRLHDFENKTSKFDITLNVVEQEETLELNFEYCTNLFNSESIEKISKHYKKILSTIILDRVTKISAIDLLVEKEKNQLLLEFNNTKTEYPEDMTIQKMFEEQVEKEPNKMAVKFEDRHLTYQELNDRANSLARVLIAKGVKANSIVGIMVERSLQMVVGIMGILKAGVAYLPIDPNYPEDRINYLLSDSQCDFLITQTDFMDKLSFNGLLVDLYCSENFEQSTENINPIYNPEDLAYIIYTSGTTGNPKGVMVQNNNLVNATYFWRRHYRLNDFDVNLLQLAGVSFDVFAGDLSRSLLSGGTMHIVSYETKLDMQKLFEIIMSEKITIFESTPNHILAFTRYLKQKKLKLENLRLLILGSDSCSISDYKTLVEEYGNQIRILNSYGVTEATIDSSYYESSYENIPDISNTPIGKPLDNTKFYILDKNQKMQPMEVCGELYIAGKGIARGYLNRPELTKEKFVANPFEPGTKMYKTGDLARWLPDGNVEFLGRIDNQVKIRGFRIELGEVEDGLLQHRAVSEAIVVSRDNKENGKYLCAYIVCEDEVNNLELKNFIKKGLPDYMVPAYIVQLENMPLTPNGKIDRKALPEPNIENLILDEYESPRNEVEEKLVEIWSETLGVKKIGINDNFFDLGGHSLKLLLVISQVNRFLGDHIPLKGLLQNQTIKQLSNYIVSLDKNDDLRNSPILLNAQKDLRIFAFPPIGGFGLAYQKLANNLEDYSLYAFDYLEEENKIDMYIEAITHAQPNGPYILLGYSAGGHLAYQVAASLEKYGNEVSDLIIMDVEPINIKSVTSEEALKKSFEEYKNMREKDESFVEIIKDTYAKEQFFRKVESYYKYLNEMVYQGIISSNIHVMKAFSISPKSERHHLQNNWQKFTKKNAYISNGSGLHRMMLSDDRFVKRNAKIIERILKGDKKEGVI